MNKPTLLKALVASSAVYLGLRALVRYQRRFTFRRCSAIITGGSRGLGLALARELVREGAYVTLLARDAHDLEQARHELEAAGARELLTFVCDVTDHHRVQEVVSGVVRRRGRVDLLINNAGLIQVGPARDMILADYQRALAVHLHGPLHTMLAVIPTMQRQGGGRIVNIASVGGKVAVPHLAPYCASKFALVGLSDALRAELSREGIYVTTVCPELMRTGSHVNVAVKGRQREEFALFAAAAGAPLVSLDAPRAARKILAACRHGQRALDLGLLVRVLAVANALAPSLMGEAMALVNHFLPPPAEGGAGKVVLTGWESRSRFAPSWLTRRADKAIPSNNELRGHSPAELVRRS